MNLKPELQALVDAWKNDDETNNRIHAEFTKMVKESGVLWPHRSWVVANQFGFGDDAFHMVWELLVHEMPDEFSFLEVGVFKGQVISLVALLAKVMEKKASIYGVTTLTNTEDVRCRYPAGDYRDWITQIHNHFKVPQPNLVVGKSNEPFVVGYVRALPAFDLVYVDAGHDYADVVADIQNYAPRTKVGGFLIMDDASIGRLNVGSCWSGLEDVAQAVKDHLDNDPRFKFLLAVGHLNVFQRVKE